jgi:glycosyltransferase involved in cell wall biosynthesis
LAQHLDFTAVHTLALARPCWRVVLVGPVKTPHRFPPNVELPGQVPHASLANWLQEADVILLPYALNDYTGAVMPAKTYEVLASGRPIVATPLPTLRDGFAAHMVFASRPDEWAGAVERALAEDSPPRRAARRAAAAPHSWEARYDDFKDLLGDAEKGCK